MTPLPGLSEAEFAELASRVPTTPPEELKASRGVSLKEGVIDLAGVEGGQALDELFPHGLNIAVDAYGNSWCVDLGGPEWGPVFYVCHDPPIVVYQAATGQEFVRRGQLPEVLECREKPAGDDAVTRAFAAELGEGWELVDLRDPQPGEGFCWGQHGPGTELRRCPQARIFARKRPAKKPFWKKLF